MSKGLDPDQNKHFVGPDLGQKLFAKFISRFIVAISMSGCIVCEIFCGYGINFDDVHLKNRIILLV